MPNGHDWEYSLDDFEEIRALKSIVLAALDQFAKDGVLEQFISAQQPVAREQCERALCDREEDEQYERDKKHYEAARKSAMTKLSPWERDTLRPRGFWSSKGPESR